VCEGGRRGAARVDLTVPGAGGRARTKREDLDGECLERGWFGERAWARTRREKRG
jgi:hypothetical protein